MTTVTRPAYQLRSVTDRFRNFLHFTVTRYDALGFPREDQGKFPIEQRDAAIALCDALNASTPPVTVQVKPFDFAPRRNAITGRVIRH